MEVGEIIKFKVKEDIFTDTLPLGPTGTNTTNETTEITQRRIPYLIKGTINESGLGLKSWWN